MLMQSTPGKKSGHGLKQRCPTHLPLATCGANGCLNVGNESFSKD